MSAVIKLVELEKRVTLKAIMADLDDDLLECLYFVTEEQIEKITALEKYDNLMTEWMNRREELKILTANV
jgi:hypothetical protein